MQLRQDLPNGPDMMPNRQEIGSLESPASQHSRCIILMSPHQSPRAAPRGIKRAFSAIDSINSPRNRRKTVDGCCFAGDDRRPPVTQIRLSLSADIATPILDRQYVSHRTISDRLLPVGRVLRLR